jgi:prepilin-type N-terminal cleavage/methylation domain-containing protein
MHHLARRGFTLIEVMVALVLLGMVSAAIYQVLVSSQRTYQAQTQRIDLQQNIRAAVTILPADFRVLDAFDGDILGMSSDSIRIKAMRVLGVVCDTSAPFLGGALTSRTVTIRNALLFGSRPFTVGTDSLLIYYEGNPASRNDDSWVRGDLTASVPANCAGDNRPGTKLTTSLQPFVLPQQNLAGNIPLGAPVWGFETNTYKLYQETDGKWYLGLRSGLDANGKGHDPATQAIYPLVGPLIGANGLTLSYYDGAGAVTAVPTSVAQIEIRVRGQTAQPVRLADGTQATQVDSIVTRVAVRNNRRF